MWIRSDRQPEGDGVTEPTRCLGRSERHALQKAHERFPSGFEIVGWKRVGGGLRPPVEVAVRPIRGSATRERSRLRLLACVNAIQARRDRERPAAGIDPCAVGLDPCTPRPGAREVWAFVGAPGSGVTRAICSLAARLHGRDRCTVGLLAAGDESHAHGLRTFGDAMGLPMEAALSAHALGDAAAAMGHRSLVLVDFPGAGPRDGDRLVSHARSLQALAPTAICAVLAADSDATAITRQLEVFRRLGATRVVLTRVDLAARLEPVLRAIVSSGMPLAWVAYGTSATGDLTPASREWVERASEPAVALA
jgi:flagellar biosynthesis protein FlhF